MTNVSASVVSRRAKTQIIPNVPLPVPYSFARAICCSATITPHAGKLDAIKLFRPQFFTYLAPAKLRSSMDMQTSLDDPLVGKKYYIPDTLAVSFNILPFVLDTTISNLLSSMKPLLNHSI